MRRKYTLCLICLVVLVITLTIVIFPRECFTNHDKDHTEVITTSNYSHYLRDLVYRSIFKAVYGWPNPSKKSSEGPIVVQLPGFAFQNQWSSVLDLLSKTKKLKFVPGPDVAWSNVLYILHTQLDYAEHCDIHFSLYDYIPRPPKEELINVYVTRGKNKARYITNESALLAQIEPNVLVIDLSNKKFTPEVQAKIFSQAKSFITVHGAALTNAIFMRPKSTVVEIMPYGYQKKTYKNLCKLCNLFYIREDGQVRKELRRKRDVGGIHVSRETIKRIQHLCDS